MPVIERPRSLFAALLPCLVLAGGCSATATEPQPEQVSEVDPWEGTNRRIDAFNTRVDDATLKPIAQGYDKVVPDFLQQGISNFSNNLRGPLHIVNNFLQGDGGEGFSETGRFLVNSTLGIGGLFDVASRLGFEEYSEDFGQTLAAWGVPPGPYVIVPFYGPSTVRDALALPLDFLADPLFYYEHDRIRYSIFGLRMIDLRARFLSVEKFVEDSYDPYLAIRESYLQHRQFEIHDGNPPVDEDFYDDFLEDLPEPE
jgi:phospholipid-binding lipoprotein MlaA